MSAREKTERNICDKRESTELLFWACRRKRSMYIALYIRIVLIAVPI